MYVGSFANVGSPTNDSSLDIGKGLRLARNRPCRPDLTLGLPKLEYPSANILAFYVDVPPDCCHLLRLLAAQLPMLTGKA